jgi:hypothetical protein
MIYPNNRSNYLTSNKIDNPLINSDGIDIFYHTKFNDNIIDYLGLHLIYSEKMDREVFSIIYDGRYNYKYIDNIMNFIDKNDIGSELCKSFLSGYMYLIKLNKMNIRFFIKNYSRYYEVSHKWKEFHRDLEKSIGLKLLWN